MINVRFALGVALFALISSAQGQYPNRPIRLIAAQSAGSSLDTIIRIVTPKMSELLGQQVVIDNRGGAGGTIGVELAARAAPDAYTLLVAGSKLGPSTVADQDGVPDGEPATSAALLTVTGAEVSALRRLPDAPTTIELRVFNPTASPTTVTVAGRTGTLVDLRGQGDESFDGELTLRPWGIQTIHLDT